MQDLLFRFISRYVPLNEGEKQALLDLDIFHAVVKGTNLLKEGQYSNKGYFVLQGCIRVYYLINGEEKTTEFYTELEGLTPNCVLSKASSEYYIATTEDTILAISTPSMEDEIFAQFPKFETLCRKLSEELLVREQLNFADFKTSSPEQRYLNLLQQRPDLLQRVPQHQLASYIGVKPQSLSRLRARISQKENKETGNK